MPRAFLTVQGNAIIATPFGDPANQYRQRITGKTELDDFVIEYGIDSFMCSSSVDFPEEYTENKEVIELCGLIRNTIA